jgi:hypothetical protein
LFLPALLNTRLDHQPATSHQAAVMNKFEKHRRRVGRTFQVVLRSWRPGHERETVEVTRDDYEAIEPGRDVATVVTKPGRLGLEWIVDFRIDHKGPGPGGNWN